VPESDRLDLLSTTMADQAGNELAHGFSLSGLPTMFAGSVAIVVDHPCINHVTPEMTLRYAVLASPTLRSAYDEAIGKVRRRIPVVPAGRPAVPTKVEWLASEYLKTRVATGYCSRHLAAEACPYANVCETCDNFVPGPEFVPALRSQLADILQLRADADQRGWTGEAARHARVANALEKHIARLENTEAAERSP
jgi:hypothetical protein